MNYAVWFRNKTPHPLLQIVSCFRITLMTVSAAMARLFLEFLSPPFTGYSCTKKATGEQLNATALYLFWSRANQRLRTTQAVLFA